MQCNDGVKRTELPSVGAAVMWHLLKAALDAPQAPGRARTRAVSIGMGMFLEPKKEQRQSTRAGWATAAFTSPQHFLFGRLVTLPGET
uniref:Uncharacterized protein n=1 Tax=Arundo donax TaxID=35708 RepID=A0A0A9CTN0_ARUDO